jgi:peroxin-5
LAVSYTNEGDGQAANIMLSKWIDLGEGKSVAGSGSESSGYYGAEERNLDEGRRVLVERLIGIARRNPDIVEGDVQVALGVLFNASQVGLWCVT